MWLGHMSERGMKILAKNDLLCRHKIKDLGFFKHCVFGNYIATNFLKRFLEQRAH
jgi:hypothetical protein